MLSQPGHIGEGLGPAPDDMTDFNIPHEGPHSPWRVEWGLGDEGDRVGGEREGGGIDM